MKPGDFARSPKTRHNSHTLEAMTVVLVPKIRDQKRKGGLPKLTSNGLEVGVTRLLVVPVLILPLLALLLLACSETPDTTEVSGLPTLEPARQTPVLTLNPQQVEETPTVELAAIKPNRPTPQPIIPTPRPTFPPSPTPTSIPVLAPPPIIPTPLVIPTIARPTPAPVIVAPPTITVPTIVLPTITIPTITVPTITVPTITVPTITIPTIEVRAVPLWSMDYETGQPQALLITSPGDGPVRGMFVDCNTEGDGDPWLALRLVGEEVFSPVPRHTMVSLDISIDGSGPVATGWLPPPGEHAAEFQRLYPAKQVGTDIINALLDGAKSVEVSAGDLRYRFETHGFRIAAKELIDYCVPGETPAPTLALARTYISPPVPPAWASPMAQSVTPEVQEFAAACATAMDAGDDVVSERDFDEWTLELAEVEAPPGLADFWFAKSAKFRAQDENGLNEHTQAAYDDEQWFITQMNQEVQDALLDAGCLSGVDVALAYRTAEAWARYEAGYGQRAGTSIEEFAQACADMKATVPAFDALDTMPRHLLYWWAQLTPPPELADYYDAVLEFYRTWEATESSDLADVPFEVEMAVVNTAEALDGDVLETLLRMRCAG